EQIGGLAGDADFAIEEGEEGRRFLYRWPDLSVTVNEMPAKDIPEHLNGFCGYVRHIYGGQPDERGEQVLDRIRYTRVVAGVVIEPERDAEGRAEGILGAMAYGLHALLFYGSALYDRDAKLILAPHGRFPPAALPPRRPTSSAPRPGCSGPASRSSPRSGSRTARRPPRRPATAGSWPNSNAGRCRRCPTPSSSATTTRRSCGSRPRSPAGC